MGDADMVLDKALENSLHIEAVTRIEEEDKEPLVSNIQTNKNSQLVNWINDLVRKLHNNQSNRQVKHNFPSQGARLKSFYTEVSKVQEKTEIEIETKIAITEAALILDEPITTVERNRQHK